MYQLRKAKKRFRTFLLFFHYLKNDAGEIKMRCHKYKQANTFKADSGEFADNMFLLDEVDAEGKKMKNALLFPAGRRAREQRRG